RDGQALRRLRRRHPGPADGLPGGRHHQAGHALATAATPGRTPCRGRRGGGPPARPPPLFLARRASRDKALALIEKAAADGARLVVFPEAFLPAWPAWGDEVLPGGDAAGPPRRREQSVVVPGPVTDRLGEAARAAGVHLVMGVNEREPHGGTVYNTILYLGDDGRLLGRHRKLVPTHAERLVWGMGGGSDLTVHPTPVGRVGGLICWENYVPLARFALYAQGVDIWVAPT